MNEEDEFISVRRLRSTQTSLESWDRERLPPKGRPVKRSMSDETSLGLRLVGELSETTCSQRIRKKIRRGIVWQAAYSAQLTHPEGLALRGDPPWALPQVSPQSSNHSEHVIVSSFPMTPYTH